MSHDKAPALIIPGKALDFLKTVGGVIAVSYSPELTSDDKWTAAVHFGREAEDSPMAEGAAYGVGATAYDAFGNMMKDLALP
jgi:hypothetical protein